jgi:Transglutaminase-like superfamily
MPSQIETTEKIKALVKNIKTPVTPEGLVEIKKIIYAAVKFLPYGDETKNDEALIRWKRTAAQILEDGYVYSGKACTDIVIIFLAFCRALGLETRFVKVKNDKTVHSIAEIKLNDGWYIYNVASKDDRPERGEMVGGEMYKGWRLWKKGRDAWDLGLVDIGSIKDIVD